MASDIKSGPSVIIQIAVFAVLSAMAAGAGWGAGQFSRATDSDAEHADAGHGKEQLESAAHEGAPDAPGGHEPAKGAHAAMTGNALPLEPMVTNLAAPEDVWVRLEMALIVDTPLEQEMSQAVHQDLFSYIRTLRLSQFEGPSGYLSFKADLLDRAQIRSAGKVKGVLIKTLLFE